MVLTFFLEMIRNTVNPLLSPPGSLFISNTFGGWGRGVLLKMGCLFNLGKMMVSVLHKELPWYLDIMKVQELAKCVGHNEVSL